ncbi:hypothetical protein GLE_2774 [Lysobacter enzymogenes]|uniref:Uncharacterized protein n=1 Tax=Lysobacter enzymogenes TaxID=69 RepID=A0A0S2DHV4_LYSEN|nr:hypothetical protein GLE_2774 [Lysobacter enzymogenes]
MHGADGPRRKGGGRRPREGGASGVRGRRPSIVAAWAAGEPCPRNHGGGRGGERVGGCVGRGACHCARARGGAPSRGGRAIRCACGDEDPDGMPFWPCPRRLHAAGPHGRQAHSSWPPPRRSRAPRSPRSPSRCPRKRATAPPRGTDIAATAGRSVIAGGSPRRAGPRARSAAGRA